MSLASHKQKLFMACRVDWVATKNIRADAGGKNWPGGVGYATHLLDELVSNKFIERRGGKRNPEFRLTNAGYVKQQGMM